MGQWDLSDNERRARNSLVDALCEGDRGPYGGTHVGVRKDDLRATLCLVSRLVTDLFNAQKVGRPEPKGVPGFEPTAEETGLVLVAEMIVSVCKVVGKETTTMPLEALEQLLNGYMRTMLVATGRLGATEAYPRVVAKPEPEKAEAAE